MARAPRSAWRDTSPRPVLPRPVVRLPFSADTWRRTFHVLLALPVSLVSVPLVSLGRSQAAARLQRGLARRYLALRIDEPAPREGAGRVLAHTVLSLPLNLASLALTLCLWLLVLANLGYPLRLTSSARPAAPAGRQDARRGRRSGAACAGMPARPTRSSPEYHHDPGQPGPG